MKTARPIWVNEDTSSAVKALYPRHMRDSLIVYAHHIDPNHTGVADLTLLEAWIDANVPEIYKGPFVLDWENPVHVILLNGGTGAERMVQELLRVLAFAKKMRPNAKCAYYGLPLVRYWPINDRLQVMRDLAKLLKPVLDASQIITPHIYDSYNPQIHADHAQADLQFVRDVARVSLEAAAGKPVLPHIWPRYPEYAPEGWGCVSIPADEFHAHIRALWDVSFKRRKINGVIWWGRDRKFFRDDTPLSRAVMASEFGNPPPPLGGDKFEALLDALHLHNMRVIDKAANNLRYDGQLPVPSQPIEYPL